MAKKIAKKKVLSALRSFFQVTGNVIRLIAITSALVVFVGVILPIWWVVDIVYTLVSPLWFPILTLRNPARASELINNEKFADGDNEFDKLCEYIGLKFSNFCNLVLMYKFWNPITNLLPMRYRKWFIANGRKPLEEYPKEVQIKYWDTQNDDVCSKLILGGIMQNGQRHRLSTTACLDLWETNDRARRLWVTGPKDESKPITETMFNFLILKRPSWLATVLLERTPNNRIWGWLISASKKDDYARSLTLALLKKATPQPEVLQKMFLSMDNDELFKEAEKILTSRADRQAVEINQVSRFKSLSQEDEDNLLKESLGQVGEQNVKKWENFCKVKKNVDDQAQMKMLPWQYFIFAEADHELSIPALQKALYTFEYRGWVKKLMQNEWKNIETLQVFPLIKADRDLYSIYLEIKAEKL